ncbi:DgyrCDS9268 [Dimorphilus gyrociliatus]|uniref:DgyrCDS9268 n=1 Tax=Dimorphilus gyrociliatus TaxID=2664684 RepID=A0A7I8VXZ7_9ANNE|nr:DgyrCDS9268 [Dimorphilus gyrociliatus]
MTKMTLKVMEQFNPEDGSWFEVPIKNKESAPAKDFVPETKTSTSEEKLPSIPCQPPTEIPPKPSNNLMCHKKFSKTVPDKRFACAMEIVLEITSNGEEHELKVVRKFGGCTIKDGGKGPFDDAILRSIRRRCKIDKGDLKCPFNPAHERIRFLKYLKSLENKKKREADREKKELEAKEDNATKDKPKENEVQAESSPDPDAEKKLCLRRIIVKRLLAPFFKEEKARSKGDKNSHSAAKKEEQSPTNSNEVGQNRLATKARKRRQRRLKNDNIMEKTYNKDGGENQFEKLNEDNNKVEGDIAAKTIEKTEDQEKISSFVLDKENIDVNKVEDKTAKEKKKIRKEKAGLKLAL